jgi:hypothetical protein
MVAGSRSGRFQIQACPVNRPESMSMIHRALTTTVWQLESNFPGFNTLQDANHSKSGFAAFSRSTTRITPHRHTDGAIDTRCLHAYSRVVPRSVHAATQHRDTTTGFSNICPVRQLRSDRRASLKAVARTSQNVQRRTLTWTVRLVYGTPESTCWYPIPAD